MKNMPLQDHMKRVRLKKRHGVLLLLVFVLFGIAFFSTTSSRVATSRTHRVVVNDTGFYPAEITIRVGDTVEFTSENNKEIWPASDLHPTHTIYPEFDPKRPIPVGEQWSFRFDRLGTWRYHDHLDPLYRGTITVGDKDKGEVEDVADTCLGDTSERLQCWRKHIEAVLDKEGIGPAFERIAELYAVEPGFQNECHGFAHLVGQRAAGLFLSGKSVPLSPKTSYCGYGFYHGFMETLLQQTGDVTRARDFCADAGAQLEKETADAEGACYHGIGHGAVDGGDPRTWGDPQSMIASAVDLCEKVGDSLQKDWRCITGAYNALEILSADPKYRISSFHDDPFPFCNRQPTVYQDGCYQNMITVLPMGTDQEFLASARRIDQAAGSAHVEAGASGILSLFHEYIRVNIQTPDYRERAVVLCRAMTKAMHVACIEGLSGGHFKYGEPEQEYVRGLAFCVSPLLTPEEREICFAYDLPRLHNQYSREKSWEICQSVPESYRHFCPSPKGA